jgi:glucuronoarabinoxylan endo-1,4-beta-xylanase
LTDAQAAELFDPQAGIGLTIVRIAMNSSGGPAGSHIWADMQKAAALGAETFVATAESPPAAWKNNGSELQGGFLLPEYYDSWSEMMAAFPAQVMENTGLHLDALSPQNEPDFASCGSDPPCIGDFSSAQYTGGQLATFVRVLGPKLHALDPPVQLVTPETREWLHVWSNESAQYPEAPDSDATDPLHCDFDGSACYPGDGYDYGHALWSDPDAWAEVDIIGTHQYDTQVAEPWPDDVTDHKPVWQLEMSGEKWWPEEGPSGDINNGVAVAGWIHDALVVGNASAWVWRFSSAFFQDDNEGLVTQHSGLRTKRLYTVGNYSRFVRPGYVRVDVAGPIPDGIEPTAFTGPDGTLVIVVINHSEAEVELPLSITGGTAPASMTPWRTSAEDDLVSYDAIAVSDGTFAAQLPALSVTTFVGR